MKTNLLQPKRKFFIQCLSILFLLSGSLRAQQNATQRVYANLQQNNTTPFLSSVTNPDNAVDGNSDDSAVFSVIAGTATQYLEFTNNNSPVTIKAGTPIFIKFGTVTSFLGLLSGLTIAPFTGLSSTAGFWSATSGSPSINGSNSLLALLNGSGTNEIEIIPQTDCNGVSISLAGLNVAASFSVYGAYYLDTLSAEAGCPKPIDVLSGSYGNIAGLLGTVKSPKNATDTSTSTYATMSAAANALSGEYITAILNTPGKAGDSVAITINNPNGGLLNLGLLSGFTFKTFNNNTRIDSIPYNSSLINLALLPGATNINVIKFPASKAFNRIEIEYGSVLDVSSLLGNGTINVYNIGVRIPAPKSTNSPSNQYSYAGNQVTLIAAMDSTGDPIEWHDQNGNVVTSSFTPAASGTFKFYALSKRDGCTENSDSLTLSLNLNVVTPGAINHPSAGTVGTPYSSNVKIAPPPAGSLPNTPKFVYSLLNNTVFNFSAELNNTYTINNRFSSFGPSSPNMDLAMSPSALPAGLTLNPDGTITGTPTQTGSSTFAVHVEDTANKDASGNNLVVGNFNQTISSATALAITFEKGSFKASLDNSRNVLLTWATSSEINASRFDVLSSTDGIHFAKIGSVNAIGNSTTLQSYNYTDNNATGLTYYKLKEVDLDNNATYSDIISIDNNKEGSIIISPNPATTYINVSGNTGLVKIFNIAGELVATGQGSHIDVRNLASGIYFLSVYQNGNAIFKQKFIKK